MAAARGSAHAAGNASATTEVHRLIQHVARAFYDTRQIVLLDQMVKGELAVRDEHLATMMGCNLKDLTKIAHPLVQQRLLAVYRRNEFKEGAVKAVPKTWYYLDLKTFIDVVKWRIFKVRKTIDDRLRDEVKTQGYDCPLCKKSFSTLDVLHLEMDPQGFKCDICGSILTDNESAAEAELGKTKIRRLLDQCSQVLAGLKKTESIVLPAFDVKKWLDLNHPVAESATAMKDADGLKIAQGGAKANVVKVEMADDDDAAAIQAKMEAEASSRRTQNALPSWIAKSTISGDLTEAGARAAQVEMLAQQDAAQRGSTTSNGSDGDAALKAYYARLAAQTESSQSPIATPKIASESPAPPALDVEEDATDSLFASPAPSNSGGKRSRGASEEEFEQVEVLSKKVKVEEPDTPAAVSVPTPAAAPTDGPEAADSDDDEDFEEVA